MCIIVFHISNVWSPANQSNILTSNKSVYSLTDLPPLVHHNTLMTSQQKIWSSNCKWLFSLHGPQLPHFIILLVMIRCVAVVYQLFTKLQIIPSRCCLIIFAVYHWQRLPLSQIFNDHVQWLNWSLDLYMYCIISVAYCSQSVQVSKYFLIFIKSNLSVVSEKFSKRSICDSQINTPQFMV